MPPSAPIPARAGSMEVVSKAYRVKIELDEIIFRLLVGQPSTTDKPTFNPIQLHDLVTNGLDVKNTLSFLKTYRILNRDQLLRAIGISERTLQRATADNPKKLDPNASDRALRLALITELASDVLGSRESAEKWLSEPAMGLEQRKPIELLQSTEGAELVKTLLTRMDYGVYS